MPLPEPKEDEDKNDFIKRCVEFIFKEGEINGKKVDPNNEDDRKQAVAICYTQWRKKRGENMKKNMRNLSSSIEIPVDLDLNKEIIELPLSTVLVGDNTYNGEFFSADEIEKSYMTLKGKPFNLDHSDKVEDEIGFIKDVFYDKNEKKLKVIPVIYKGLPKASVALEYIKNRQLAGSTGEVSVGVYVNPVIENQKTVVKDLVFDHLALVTSAACSPEMGAGIGLKSEGGEKMSESELREWDSKYINDLPDAAFAYIEPGGEKDEEGKTVPRSKRHLPHHNMTVKDPDENESVDKPHLRNALARLPQTKIPEDGKKKAKAHLIKHAKALGIGDYEEESNMTEEIKEEIKEEKVEAKDNQNDELSLLKEKIAALERLLSEKKTAEYEEKNERVGVKALKMIARTPHIKLKWKRREGGE